MRRIITVLLSFILPCLSIAQQAPLPVTGPSDAIVIPVVVHLVHNGKGAAVTDEQVYSQIDALNRDYNARNADLAGVPAHFSKLVANCRIRFELAKVDPAGRPSSGIVRRETTVQQFTLDDKIKFTSSGGDDAWPRDHYLNIWVGPLFNAINGYSSQPGAKAEVDGVVINSLVFGTINKRGSYSKGRIAVHEVGHWLGLKHIWGDGYCGDDGIDDTPKQKSYNKGCPSGKPVTCGSGTNGDMYMNYMDMTDDACMFMFTEGQKNRMWAQFQPGGARAPLLSSGALLTDGKPIDPAWGQPPSTATTIKSLAVYPVPATKELRVDIQGAVYPGRRMLVYNMTGQVMMTVEATQSPVQLDISSLKSGQYILRMENASSAATAKFVKL